MQFSCFFCVIIPHYYYKHDYRLDKNENVSMPYYFFKIYFINKNRRVVFFGSRSITFARNVVQFSWILMKSYFEKKKMFFDYNT